MKRYVKGVLGGILAILAAFGWTVTITAVIAWKFGGGGIARSGGGAFWLILLLIFSVGFYLGFRTVYSPSSK